MIKDILEMKKIYGMKTFIESSLNRIASSSICASFMCTRATECASMATTNSRKFLNQQQLKKFDVHYTPFVVARHDIEKLCICWSSACRIEWIIERRSEYLSHLFNLRYEKENELRHNWITNIETQITQAIENEEISNQNLRKLFCVLSSKLDDSSWTAFIL